jgi:histidinol dehydrogenase
MSAPRRITMDAGDAERLAETLRPAVGEGPAAAVADALSDVRARGDAALVDAIRQFDAPGFTGINAVVPADALAAAEAALAPALRAAIGEAIGNVRAVAEASLPTATSADLPAGQSVRIEAIAVDAAGVYAPGGRAAYPSSVIMGVVPAQVAGVRRIVLATPAGPDGLPNPVVLATASILGVDQVIAVGGAAAVGALAYGTETVDRVDVITGPGNPWVQEAKRQVFGTVGIDSIAGPSELVVLLDATADPVAIAADLLAQAEHGADSPSVAAAWDPAVLDALAMALSEANAPVGTITLVDCASQDDAIDLAEAFAPEHLQIATSDAWDIAPRIRRAGCVFLGPLGATAFGDYVAGSNHILPTGGAARHASSVGPATYMRRMALVTIPQSAVDRLTPHLAALADAEGFPEHRRSAEVRASS